MSLAIQIGLIALAGLFFLVRLGIFLAQAREHEQIIQSRARRAAQ